MRERQNRIRLLAAVFAALLLCGCTRETDAVIEPDAVSETLPEELGYVKEYEVSAAVIADQNETVLFQQRCEGGFLALINRKVREEIPDELKDDPEFVNDGRYDVYESALFRVTKNGKRDKVRRYRTLPAPENTEGLERYFSEMRPRAFRVRPDGLLIALESSYESWLDGQTSRYRDRYYVRVLRENGTALSCYEIETDGQSGLDCGNAVCLGDNLLAAPQGKEVLFFGTDGKKLFSVASPFRIKELCATADGKLAVLLQDKKSLWISVIDPVNRSAAVPLEIPEGAHGISAGSEPERLYYLRNSELFSFDMRSGQSEKTVSLLSIDVVPASVGAFFAAPDDSLHFLIHSWLPEAESICENYVVASKNPVNTEKKILTLGFDQMSNALAEAVIRFNRSQDEAVLEPVDYRNLSEAASGAEDLSVLDETLFGLLSERGELFDAEKLLRDAGYDTEQLLSSVKNALRDETGVMRGLIGCFRIETMACDWDTVDGQTQLNMEQLRSYFAAMSPGSILYEPYYTSERLLSDLLKVNRSALKAKGGVSEELYAKLRSFSNLQPQAYSYDVYTSDSSSMESRIYRGTLLFLQAHISTLDDLKWYDAFFRSGACFPGWPTESGSASRLCYDECLGANANLPEEKRAAAGAFLRTILDSEYAAECNGFPAEESALEKLMTDDASWIVYKVDEDANYVLDKQKNRIEVPRSTWYSPEWRKHEIFAVTAAQREKLLTLIRNAV